MSAFQGANYVPMFGAQGGPKINTAVFEKELESYEDKPWRKPGANLADYFNYGFNEETWELYRQKQTTLRIEQNMQNKIKVYKPPTEGDEMARELMEQLVSEKQGEYPQQDDRRSYHRSSSSRRYDRSSREREETHSVSLTGGPNMMDGQLSSDSSSRRTPSPKKKDYSRREERSCII